MTVKQIHFGIVYFLIVLFFIIASASYVIVGSLLPEIFYIRVSFLLLYFYFFIFYLLTVADAVDMHKEYWANKEKLGEE